MENNHFEKHIIVFGTKYAIFSKLAESIDIVLAMSIDMIQYSNLKCNNLAHPTNTSTGCFGFH